MSPAELLLDDFALASIAEIRSASGLSAEEIDELIALGVFEPVSREATLYSARCIELARAARRLMVDFDLSPNAVALALAYRSRIRQLEAELRRLECQLPARGG